MDSDDSRAVHERLAYLEELIGALGAVVWEYDWPSGAFTYVSDGASRMLGYPVGQWLEPGFWPARLHPDDLDAAVAYCQTATEEGRDHEFEYRMVRRDGSEVWIRDIADHKVELGVAMYPGAHPSVGR